MVARCTAHFDEARRYNTMGFRTGASHCSDGRSGLTSVARELGPTGLRGGTIIGIHVTHAATIGPHLGSMG